MAKTFTNIRPSSGGGGGDVTSVNGQTGDVVLTKASIGLGNVNNTSDANKPVSTAQQAALDLKADIDNPTFTGQVLIADGTASAPGLAFASDNDQDSGLYTTGDGIVSVATNGVESATFTTAGLNVIGDITAANFPLTGNANSFALYDASGDATSLPEIGYNPNNFNSLNLNQSVVPDDTTDFKRFGSVYANYNPTVTDSEETWQHFYVEAGAGTDDSGNQVGTPEIKSTLVFQDITYTSKRTGADGNVISIEYTGGGTAGSEVVTSPSSFVYEIQIENGVSTAQNIVDAINDSSNPGDLTGTLLYSITGTASNAQVVDGPELLAGGVNAQGGIQGIVADIYSRESSNVGGLTGVSSFIGIGNDTDPIHSAKLQAYNGNISVNEGCEADYVSAIEVGVGVDSTASVINDVRGFNLYGNMSTVGGGLIGSQIGLNADSIRYINSYQTTLNVDEILQGNNTFADFNTVGDISGNYYGVAIQPSITNAIDSFYGVNVSPNIDNIEDSAVGLNVDMSNVTVYAGVKASVTIQDLFIEALEAGSFLNDLTVEYVDDGTAGAETAAIVGLDITVHMESGVSTATQIRTALLNVVSIAANLSVTVSGVGSNPQVSVGPTNLAGGINAGNAYAAQFTGDVSINGDLSFTGALAIGRLNAFANYTVIDGGGAPQSVHAIIDQMNVAASATIANADTIGVNTAALINIGDNATVTSGFLGLAALALPAVLTMGTGSTVDRVSGAAFALSLDAGATGGTVDTVDLCRAIAIPNGATAITNLRGFTLDLPFGDPGTTTWGIYIDPAVHNYMAGALKIGGSDTEDASAALEIQSTTRGFLNARMTSTERDAITAVNGLQIYNTTTDKFQGYAAGVWVDLH